MPKTWLRALAIAAATLAAACRHAPPAPAVLDEIARLEDAREPGALRIARRVEDDDPRIRVRALRALGHVQDPASLPAMVRALGDPDATVRREAAFAFELLGLAWEGLDEPVRGEAERAVLTALAGAPAAERPPLLLALGTLAGDEGAKVLGVHLTDRDPLQAAAAARALAGYVHRGKRTWTGPLPDALGDTLLLRRARAYLLYRAASPASAELLASALADPDAEVRALAAKGLAALKDAYHLRQVARSAMQDLDWRPRVEAVRALAAVAATSPPGPGDKWSAAHLFQLSFVTAALWLDQALYEAPELAAPITELAADHHFAGTVPGDVPMAGQVLLAALESKAPAAVIGDAAALVLPGLVRARTAAASGTTHKRDLALIECLVAGAVDRAGGALDELPGCGGEAITPIENERLIARALAHPEFKDRERELLRRAGAADPTLRALVVEGLGKIPKEQLAAAARKAIRDALADADGPVVANAAEATAAIGDGAAAPALLAALDRFAKPADAEIEQSIITALGALKVATAQPRLSELLASPAPALRLAARDALAALGVKAASPPPASFERAAHPLAPPAETRLLLETEKGRIVIAFARDAAPATTHAIADLARKGFYDGLTFHRVVPDFVVQGGDPRGDGWGSPGQTLRCEPSPLRYERGAVGMALSGKDTGGSQFFIAHSMQPHLDGRYTIFGLVLEGMDVVDRLLPGDRIKRATVEK